MYEFIATQSKKKKGEMQIEWEKQRLLWFSVRHGGENEGVIESGKEGETMLVKLLRDVLEHKWV